MSTPNDTNPPGAKTPHRVSRARRRQSLRAHLVHADGHLVSTHPDIQHGTERGYDLFGCRCTPCSDRVALRHQQLMDKLHAYRVEKLRGLLSQYPEVTTTASREDLDKLVLAWRGSRASVRRRALAQLLGPLLDQSTCADCSGCARLLADDVDEMLRESRDDFQTAQREQREKS